MARPEFKPTDEQRRSVSIAAGAGGMSHEEIALGLDIDRGTLEKHFARELSVGAYERRIEVLNALHGAACKGNVTAAREYLSRTPLAAAPPAKPDEDKPEKLGKKEQAQLDARSAHLGTDWADLVRPGKLN